MVIAPVFTVVCESPWLTVLVVVTGLVELVVVTLGLFSVVDDVPVLVPEVAPMFCVPFCVPWVLLTIVVVLAEFWLCPVPVLL